MYLLCGEAAFAQWVFEMDIKRCNDDHLDIDFHYCPLAKAWQKQGYSDGGEIRLLCDHAMFGDRGIAGLYRVRVHPVFYTPQG